MESDGDRHWLGVEIVQPEVHFQNAGGETVSHFDGVSEWKLGHPRRLTVEFQAACHPGGFGIGFDLRHGPLVGGGKKTVTRTLMAWTTTPSILNTGTWRQTPITQRRSMPVPISTS